MSTTTQLRAEQLSSPASRAVETILGVGIVIRLLAFALSYNSGGDAMARVDLSAAWLSHPNFNLFAFKPWLPLHFWVIAGSMSIFGPTIFAARLVSLLAAVASLFLFWNIARRLYNRRAATLSLLVFALYTVHIGYSGVSSSEAFYLCLVLLGICSYFSAVQSGRTHQLLLSGVSFTAAAAVRYEAWVLILAFGLVLAYRAVESRRLKEVMVFSASASIWPFLWMIVCWRKTGNLLYFIAMNHEWVPEQIRETPHSILYRLTLPPGVLLISLSILCLAGVYWIFHLNRERLDGELVFAFLLFAAVQFAQIISGGVMSFARYTISMGTFLALFSGPGLIRLWTQLRFRPTVLLPLSCAILALNVAVISAVAETRLPGSDKLRSIGPRMRFPHRIDDVGQFLHDHLRPGDRVVLDYYNEESGSILLEADLYQRHGDIFEAFPRQVQGTAQYVEQQHPKYFVYAENGTISHYLRIASGCSRSSFPIAGVRSSCVFENEVYRIYELTYAPAAESAR